jgi:hypothetical protein
MNDIVYCDWNGCVLAAGHVGTCREIYGKIINGPRSTVEKCPCNVCTPISSFDELLKQKYDPPQLFICEEVEIGSRGYHALYISNSYKESNWSEPYKKSGCTEYRRRVVKVPFPPAK